MMNDARRFASKRRSLVSNDCLVAAEYYFHGRTRSEFDWRSVTNGKHDGNGSSGRLPTEI